MKKKESKKITFNIRMSEEDKEKLKILAKAEGMGMSAYLREVALGRKPGICCADIQDILESIDQINSIWHRDKESRDEGWKQRWGNSV